MPSEREMIVDLLEMCKWYNDGAGLIISQALADKLKEMDIDGPFTVDTPIPTEGVLI